MAISTFSELRDFVIHMAWRAGDVEFAAQLPNYIALAESRLNVELPLRAMEVAATIAGTPGSRSLPLPDDFCEAIALELTTFGSFTELRPTTTDDMRRSASPGTPTVWSVDAEAIVLDCPCDQAHTFEFRYRRRYALSDDAPTNWLLKNHPDAYVAAVMVWGTISNLDPEVAATQKGILEEAIASIGWKEGRNRVGPATVDRALAGRGGFDIRNG